MIRKTRLVKVICGSCAAIFLILQILDTSSLATFKSKEDLASISGVTAASASTIIPTKKVLKTTVAAAAVQTTKNTSSLMGNAAKKEATSNSEEEPKVTNLQEPKSPLSGERIHGLPNETFSNSKPPRIVQEPDSRIARILEKIRVINDEQSIKNEDIFGPVTNSTVVIAVQVHNRLPYLRQLIISLSAASGIDKSLIIFSHDYWDEGINDLVNSVDFAKTMQIFYPFSIQTHPREFPGESPNDCPRNAKKDQAKRLHCLNADWPDLYGHYREAKFTQTKHHWWWKANRIFDQLRVTKVHDGLVLFLEEDHYVSEDFLSVLHLVDAERMARYPNCDIICLGTYLKSYNYNRDGKAVSSSRKGNDHVPGFVAKPGGGAGRPVPAAHHLLQPRKLLWLPGALLSSVIDAFRKVDLLPWESAKHNMGMAFKRTFWEKIMACKEYFCNYDDYNWDWSLQYLSKECFKSKLEVMLVKGPRVFHIGECGVHHKKKQCEAVKVVRKVKDILAKAQSFLFPSDIKVTKVVPKRNKNQKNPKGNGGWGDHRDRALCLNMAVNNRTLSEQVIHDLNIKPWHTKMHAEH